MGRSDVLGKHEFTCGGVVIARMEVHDAHVEDIGGHDVVWMDLTLNGKRRQFLMSSDLPNLELNEEQ